MEQETRQRNRWFWFGAGLAAIVLLTVGAILLWRGLRSPTVLNPARYISVFRDDSGVLAAAIDASEMLSDLHLPSPADDARAAARYPDVNALLHLTVALSETDDPDAAEVAVSVDTETLAAYGIEVAPTEWTSPVSDAAEALANGAQIAAMQPVPSPTPTVYAKLLHSLVDENGCGYNLRAICERVQTERDAMLEKLFGSAAYNFEKTQVSFSDNGAQNNGFQNCYQAVYRAWPDTDDGKKNASVYFRIRIYRLMQTPNGVTFQGEVLTSQHKTEAEAKKAPYVNTVILSGGGMQTEGRNAFDQNGFVLFPNCPTSYRMANGVYWSPTYDLLDEDTIWSLTAVEGHSLANLLRYARKEISARYYAGFDPKSEREFYEHYTQYGWYHELTPDRTPDMTEAEYANIRLLREIQSLVEK